MFAKKALAALAADSILFLNCRYLVDPENEQVRGTILAELGRFPDPRSIRATALAICDERMPTRKVSCNVREAAAAWLS